MNIAMVLKESVFPGDIRVENEALALVRAGHQVTVVCDPVAGRPAREIYEGINVVRVPPAPVLFSKVNTLIYYLTLKNYYWHHFLQKLHAQQRFDALHVHDLPLTGTVLDAGRKLGIPVLFDNHENYPDALNYYDKRPKGIPKALWPSYVFDPNRWRRYEKQSFRTADRIITTVPEMTARTVGLGIPAQKIVVVSNTPNLTIFDAFPIDPEISARYKDRFVISYIGSLSQHRRLDTIVRAMPAILAEIPEALLLVVGGIKARPELPELADRLNLSHAVELLGWQDFSRMPSYIAASAVGVLPQEPNEHTSNTIPHKLFQYMYMQTPQVVSNCTAVARIINESQSGLVCEAGLDDDDAWAQAIISLRDADRRREMGLRGREAVITHYNWSIDKQRLIKLYDDLQEGGAN